MQRLTLAISIVLLLSMIIMLFHSWNQPERQKEMNDSLKERASELNKLSSAIDRLAASQEALAEQQAALLVAIQEAGSQQVGSQQIDLQSLDQSPQFGDGVVKPGVNFLLPPDDSYFDPEKVGGELRTASDAPPGLNSILVNAANTSSANSLVNDGLAENDSVDITLWRSSLATSAIANDNFTEFEIRIEARSLLANSSNCGRRSSLLG